MSHQVKGRLGALGATILVAAGLLAAPPAAAQSAGAAEPTTRTISFTTDECTYCAFDISPDGRWIVFDLLGQLWRIPADGGDAVPLTDTVKDAAEDVDPSFSPDGEWIVFSGDRGGVQGVWIMAAGGGEVRLVAATEYSPEIWRHSSPAFAPDGRRITFSNVDRFHLHDLGSGSTVPIELDDQPESPLQAAWLPDGRIIARLPQRAWYSDPGGRLHLIDAESGEVEDLDTRGRAVSSPVASFDGKKLAYLAADEEGHWQVWIQSLDGGEPVQLTEEQHVIPVRVRWAPDGNEVLYSARGRLWRIDIVGREPREIPFTVTVRFERDEPELPAVRFSNPGSDVQARGHTGLALSPDGDRIALIALGRLWDWRIGEEPVAVREVPATAGWVSWAPDGHQMVWSAGPGGAEDLYVTHLETGATRQLTALPGKAYRPSWSPDGEHIAFIYWPAPAFPHSDAREDQRVHFAVVGAGSEMVSDRSEVLLLGEVTEPEPEEVPVWAPGSDALLDHPARGPGWRARWWQAPDGEWKLLPLEGEARPVERLPVAATFLQWAPSSSLVYVHANQLWRAEMRDGSVGEPVRLTDEAALYPSVARDGTILYVGEGGYRLRRPDGTIEALGWPLSYRVPEPEPLLIRNARIIRGTGAPPSVPSDVLLENGRIAAIAPAGTLQPDRHESIIDANGRVLLPGLIDLHVHGSEHDIYLASLYHGVTTLRESGAPIAWSAALRDMAEAGVHPGPRVILGGPQINPGDPHPSSGSSVQNLADTQDVERALTLLQAFGASYAKMRGPRNWAAGADFVRAAHRRGMRVSGHCAYPLLLIATGIDHKEHVGDCRTYLEDSRADLIRMYVEAGVALVPTLAASATWSGRAAARAVNPLTEDEEVFLFLTPGLRWSGGYYRSPEDVEHDAGAWLQRLERLVVKHRAGVAFATGTDEGYLPGAIHLELEELVASGLTPLQAITAATSTAARLLGAEHEIGTVEVGKWADLILLDADPLEDIRNTRQIWTVIQGGRVVDREAFLDWARESRPMEDQK